MGFVKRHLYETVLALLVLVSGGAVTAFSEALKAAAVEHPAAFGFTCVAVFALGFVVGLIAGQKRAENSPISTRTGFAAH